jgi:nitrite reductase (NO-forming)
LVGLVAATLLPMRRALGVRHRIVVVGYALGLLSVIAGVSLVTAFLHDVAVVQANWGVLKPAHAWLNLIGFVSLVIVTTLIHLAPTVLGARIVGGRLPTIAVVGLAAAVVTVATGLALGSDLVARIGAVLALVAAIAGPAYLAAVVRQEGRGHWTTDLAWHRFTGWSLIAAAGWIAAGIGAAAVLVLIHGATPAGWSLSMVGIPLVIGGASQAVVGAASHLLPTLGPGGMPGHARARASAGRGTTLRVLLFEVGVLGWWAAVSLSIGGLAAVLAGAAVGTAVVADVLLLVAPLWSLARRPV